MDWQSIKENIKENIKETTSNIYSYLEDILIIKEYEINRDDDLITKTEMFVLRYRRILGIILLCIIKSSLSSWNSGKIRVIGLSTIKNSLSVFSNALYSCIESGP